jgi:biotin carboxylase
MSSQNGATAPAAPRILHLVSPSSLQSWFTHFVTLGDGDRIEWLGEHPTLSVAADQRTCGYHAEADLTVLHSSHDTLIRDIALSSRLEGTAPRRLIRQSATAAVLGTDKLAMKRQLEAWSLPIVPWRHPSDGVTPEEFAARHEGPFVVKLRNGTEGRALRLRPTPEPELADGEFEEPFVGGTEYSVVVLRVGGRELTFPAIWKGPTRRDLLPPYQRLRLCPAPDLSTERDDELRSLSLRASAAMASEGFAEVELIIDGEEQARVIEVNPRIAGTMRMAALACDQRIFDLPAREDAHGHLAAQRRVVEMPHQGEPWNDPAQLVYCTSRLTAAADTWGELPARVDAAIGAGSAVPLEWRRSLDLVLSELCVTP